MVADYFVDAKDQELERSALTRHASSGANSGNVNMSLEQKGKGLEASPQLAYSRRMREWKHGPQS